MTKSFRKYKVTYFDREDVKEMDVRFNDLTGQDVQPSLENTELLFSLQENLDQVLDLKLWDRMTFLEDREDQNSLSILIRIA